MKIVLAPDSFKGTLTAYEVSSILEKEILNYDNNIEVINLPVSDGGEGTHETLNQVIGGQCVNYNSVNALNEDVETCFLVKDGVAFIESAKTIGLPQIYERRNPFLTSSYGLGKVINQALKEDLRTVIVSLGGSATNDGGCGMLSALGAKFYDKNGIELFVTGENLCCIEKIDLNGLNKKLQSAKIVALSDVENVLLGEFGASYIFAPQKGATPIQVKLLEEGMNNLSLKIAEVIGEDFSLVKGSGAAGGLGFMLCSVLKAEIKSGIDVILGLMDFESKAAGADFVISGEGKVDSQSFCGKVISGIGRKIKYPTKFIVIGGYAECGQEDAMRDANIFKIYSTTDRIMSMSELKKNAAYNLAKTMQRIIKEIF